MCQLGVVEYREALALQERVRAARQADAVPDVMLVLEHPPVYTRGRRSGPGELPMTEDWYRAQGIDIIDVDRGGKITYHGPGQLVGYPIMRIGNVREDVHTMERAMVQMLADEKVEAYANDELTGIWVGERKIGSIGVHVQSRVTTHGFAINVDNDLQPFEWVVPCGIEGVAMTSILREGGSEPSVVAYGATVARHFAAVFDREPRAVSAAELGLEAAPATVGGER